MTTDKKGIKLLADIFVKKGMKHIVISPGSRNAPIINSFGNHPEIEALSIIDERSAAFFAMGIAQQSRKTVAISCTSGTAVLNYAPAIAEAYYQKIPLLILTADRPAGLIDQGDGQTIRQNNIYTNYIKKSFELPMKLESEEDLKEASAMINEAINLTQFPDCGPVHINLPFAEPLYNLVEDDAFQTEIIDIEDRTLELDEKRIKQFAKVWNQFDKKLLIAGMMNPNPELHQLLKSISNDDSVVLLTETTSNLKNSCDCPCIDKVVATISDSETEKFQPQLLVTFGGYIVSKMIKAFIRKNKPIAHWHIDPVDFTINTYQCLTNGIQQTPMGFFEQLIPYLEKKDSDYKQIWQGRDKQTEERHSKYLKNCRYSDLKVFETLLNSLPENSQLQLGNSTPVRYAQLFKSHRNLNYFSNRGTSGIDGVTSTAAGAAWVADNPVTVITGDLGFFYDSNALMNNHLKGNLRIIIINNGGGGIFRFIDGPDRTSHLEEFFETKHNWNAKYLAKAFNITYTQASTLDELEHELNSFFDYSNRRPAILEIFTPSEENGEILRSYFKNLKA
jgi:2-succinyl-5-enolpyruvyl-6-hydroxy-3-cyclohexene-1-carboxylate synthase